MKYRDTVVAGIRLNSSKEFSSFSQLSAYFKEGLHIKNLIDNFEKPDVESINGLSPVISIEQRSISKNPRSTVGTITEIYDYLRLLFSKISYAKSYNTGKKMIKLSSNEIIKKIITKYTNKSIYILSPLIRSRKGNYKTFFMDLLKNGFIKVRVNGKIRLITDGQSARQYEKNQSNIRIQSR